MKTSPGYSFFHTIKHIRGNSLTVCKCNICAGVYIHMWQYVQCVWVCQEGSVLLSPSTVLIKASEGRQKGWTEREGGGGKDMHVWLPDLCDGERERGREGWIGKSGDTTHQAPEIISSSWLCCNSYSSMRNAKYYIFIDQKYAAFFLQNIVCLQQNPLELIKTPLQVTVWSIITHAHTPFFAEIEQW